MENNLFYSEDWRQEVFAFGSLPFFDLMIDEEHLYLIKMPKWEHPGFKEKLILVLTFLFSGFGLLGAFSVGDIRKRKYYKTYRSLWIDSNHKLISQSYKKDVFIKIPLNELKNNIVFGKNKVTVSYEGNKVVLVRKLSSLKLQKSIDPEFTRLSQYLERYFPIEFVKNKFTIV
jgi:hypothetical protein